MAVISIITVEIMDEIVSIRHVVEEMNFDLEVQGLSGYDVHAGFS